MRASRSCIEAEVLRSWGTELSTAEMKTLEPDAEVGELGYRTNLGDLDWRVQIWFW
jgi:hypothetical protein